MSAGMDKHVLVTGGAGFIGCNLADHLAGLGNRVLVYDSLQRPGVEANVAWLRERHPGQISVVVADIRDRAAIAEAVSGCQAVFHLAAQVAVTTSMLDPRTDFEVNVLGTLNVLEALRRRRPAPPLIFASTNKVYGDLADIALEDADGAWLPRDVELRRSGVSEERALNFHTPYGCSKGAADQYVLDYARSFGVPTAVLRMSCIYGDRQRGTEDQGWVAHFLLRALAGEPITIYGDGKQVRDILHVSDAIAAYVAVWRRISAVTGQAFNLGGGPDNAVSLCQVVGTIEAILGRPVALRFADWRPGDQRYFVADTRRAAAALGLERPLGWRNGLARLAHWFQVESGIAHMPPQRAQTVPAETAA
jgi:CDP-paratose 2-epimerase